MSGAKCAVCRAIGLRECECTPEQIAFRTSAPLPDSVDLEQAWRAGKGLKLMPPWLERLWRIRYKVFPQ